MLSVLEGYVADGRIRKARILYNSIKDQLPVKVRVLYHDAIENKIDEIKRNNKERRLNERSIDKVAAKVAFESLFKGETK